MANISSRHIKSHKINHGFTLLELVAVIMLVAILSVIGSAYLIDLTTDARKVSLKKVEASLKTGITEVHAFASIKGNDKGDQTLSINGTSIDIKNGYPTIDGSETIPDLLSKLLAWVDLDIVDRDTASLNRTAALYFLDKSPADNTIFIFFSSDFDRRSPTLRCQVRYKNNTEPSLILEIDDC